MSPGVSNHTRRLSLKSYITSAPSSTQLKSFLFVAGFMYRLVASIKHPPTNKNYL